jgi:hypothetical protein
VCPCITLVNSVALLALASLHDAELGQPLPNQLANETGSRFVQVLPPRPEQDPPSTQGPHGRGSGPVGRGSWRPFMPGTGGGGMTIPYCGPGGCQERER